MKSKVFNLRGKELKVKDYQHREMPAIFLINILVNKQIHRFFKVLSSLSSQSRLIIEINQTPNKMFMCICSNENINWKNFQKDYNIVIKFHLMIFFKRNTISDCSYYNWRHNIKKISFWAFPFLTLFISLFKW